MDYLEEEEEDPEMIIEEKEDEENNAEETMITGLEVEKDDLVQEKENIDSDLELLETTSSVFMTPKKRAVKIREQLDDGFLRHSKRVSQKLGGFRDAESANKHKEGKSGKDKNEPKNSKRIKGSKSIKKQKENATEADVPIPLAMIPPAGME
jgi:hypothetical protein